METKEKGNQGVKILLVVVVVALAIFAVLAASQYMSASSKLAEANAQIAELQAEVDSKKDAPYTTDLAAYGLDDLTKFQGMINYLNSISNGGSGEHFGYVDDYEALYVDNDFIYEDKSGEKIAYLTFDDGPAPGITDVVLDTLKEYGVKATFFVVYRDSEACRALYKRMYDEGHTLAVHSASHDYNKIYASVDAFLADFADVAVLIHDITGEWPEIFRFPGGSINGYNKATYQEIIAEMTRRGYTYYDWNCSSGDAAGKNVATDSIVYNVLNYGQVDHKIVLMHDGAGHKNTAAGLGRIISGLKDQGYSFDRLTKDVAPAQFGH